MYNDFIFENENKTRGKSIRYWASVTFEVYVIHMHPAVKKVLLLNNFVFIKDVFIWFIPL